MPDPDVPPPLDLLLARRDWVRRFARVLARDDWAADDLAQDAWVAAVERTPEHAEAPAGWFRRVMTRRAMDLSRATRRRVAHEAAAARPQVTSDVADVVAAAEVHRRVVEAVVALPEPYRTTVLLRFFEDLPPREVAARMEVPVETVRARVRRAVERLRAQLDAEHGGRRADWLGALWAGDGGSRSGPGAGAARTASMRWAAGVAVVAGAAVGIVGVLVPDGDDPDPAVASAPADGDPEPPAAARPPTRAAAPRADGDAESENERPAPDGRPGGAGEAVAQASLPRTFVVSVTDPSGAPVSGVRVQLDPAEMDAEPEGVTGADGVWKASVAGPVRFAMVLEEGADGRAWRSIRHGARIAPTADGVQIVVEPAVWIRGEVLHEDGRPFAGAQVVALESDFHVADVYCDRTGAFALAVPPGGTYDVALTGYLIERFPNKDRNTPNGRVRVGTGRWGPYDAEASRIAAPAAGVGLTARIAEETNSLRVRILGADGRPVAGMPLAVDRGIVWEEPARGPSVTDAEGRCVIEDVPCRRVGLGVAGNDPDRRPWEAGGSAAPRMIFVRPGGDEVLVVLPRGVRLHGRVEVPAEVQRRDDPLNGRVSVGVTEDRVPIASALARPGDTFDFLVPADARLPRTVRARLVDAEGVSWTAEADLPPGSSEGLVLHLVAEPVVWPHAALAPARATAAPK